jgi:hypothetical protein
MKVERGAMVQSRNPKGLLRKLHTLAYQEKGSCMLKEGRDEGDWTGRPTSGLIITILFLVLLNSEMISHIA